MKRLLFIIGVGLLVLPLSRAADSRALRFQADSPEQVRAWQQAARQRLFELMMGGAPPARVPLEPKLLRRVEKPAAGYALEELTLQTLAELGYVVVAPDIGQHELQHPGQSLMGERTWDTLRCLDYLVTLPEVDSARLAVAGLSLGGETAMYVAALDERIKLTCSSGWLTTVDNMKRGHCP